MRIVTHQQLIAATGCTRTLADIWLPALNKAMAHYGINKNSKRIAAFLAQVGHESVNLSRTSENLNYSAARLCEVWPGRFDRYTAAVYARQPEAIANRAYAGRFGNRDEKSGDGWRFRGRGPFQITFRDNYRACGLILGLPLENDPDLLLEPEHGAMAAGWYWDTRDLNKFADADQIDVISRRINGGNHGLESRRARYIKALRALTE